jgi:transcriptional regulator with XRE-family HTH domain
MIDMTSTATTIKSLRRDHGLTQEDLADRAGCGLATIQRAEAGKPLATATIAAIAAAFDIPVSELAVAAVPKFEPYLPLERMNSGRALVAVLLGASRIDFDFCELDTLADAEPVQDFHDFCQTIAALEAPLAPIDRVGREIEARHKLDAMAARGFCIGAGSYEVIAYEVDDDCGSGSPILFGQSDVRCAAIRIGRTPDEIVRAHVLRALGQWENVKSGALIEPPRKDAEIDWLEIFDFKAPEQGEA